MWQKVVIISECIKNTRKKSHAILDKYLYRIGSQSWEGKISTEGLKDLYSDLKKVSSKNMSIVARIITNSGSDKILWRLGNKSKFSESGFYSIKSKTIKETLPHRTNIYNYLIHATIIAACFHDFGKMTKEFQNKLKKRNKTDKLRHELISLYLFNDIYNIIKNKDFLITAPILNTSFKNINKELNDLSQEDENKRLNLINENDDKFKNIIKYLIISHHKIPDDIKLIDGIHNKYIHTLTKEKVTSPTKTCIDVFLESDHGKLLIKTIQKHMKLLHEINIDDNISNIFPGLIAYGRIALIMADHYYSSLKDEKLFTYIPLQDANENILYANTGYNKDKISCLVQPLSQHLHGVSTHVNKIMRNIYNLRDFPIWEEPEKPNDIIEPILNNNKFDWQYYAHNAVKTLPDEDIGFIGFMMAGTGSGKTRTNMLLMSELNKNTRFTVALGLRNLTLQTGTEYKHILGKNNLSVHIGSEPILTMHESDNNELISDDIILTTDESGSEIEIDENYFIDDCEYQKKPDLVDIYIKPSQQQYMLKPVLVSTIDSLMYSEKKPHMALRLMTSDLVIDEIDNYDVVDQVAIMRLVKLSGSYGRKVIISSATLPPATAEAMFIAYQEGYKDYCLLHEKNNRLFCGWFSEYNKLNMCEEILEDNFKSLHTLYIDNMINEIENKIPLRRASILKFGDTKNKDEIFNFMLEGCLSLHQTNHTIIPNSTRKLSVGFVRIADISTVAEFSKFIANQNIEDIEHRVLCYHSHYPLIIRNYIEKWLDNACNRKKEYKIFEDNVIKELVNSTTKDIMIIVVATPVEEVGRDHDFDYMLNSLSSHHSLIQGAGRVLRHRVKYINHINCLITERPIKAYKAFWNNPSNKNAEKQILSGPAFLNPGVETNLHIANVIRTPKLEKTLISEICNINHSFIIDSRYCISNNNWNELSELEHKLSQDILINVDRSGVKSISGSGQLFNFGYKDFRFRKKQNTYDIEFLYENNNWSIKYLGQSNQYYKVKVTDKVDNIQDNGKYLLKFDTHKLFEEYYNKYFQGRDKKIVYEFLMSINISIYINEKTVKNKDIQKMIYNDQLGLYKAINA